MGKGTVAIVGISVVALLSYGAVIGLSGITLVHPVPVAAVGAAAAAGLIPFMSRFWSRILAVKSRWPGILCQMVVMTGLLMALFYISNYAFADKTTLHEERVLVEQRYTETHYRSKRISRNRYVRGEPYKVYYLKIELPGGWHRPMMVNQQKYNRTHVGDTVPVPVAKGLFGLSVIKR